LNQFKYCSPLVAWLEGLQIVIASGIISATNPVTKEIWKSALALGETKQLELLLSFGIPVTVEDWHTLLGTWSTTTYSHSKVLADEIAQQRSNVLETMANQLVPNSVSSVSRDFRDHHDNIGTLLKDPPLYGSCYLSVLAAEIAWAAGCRNLNSNKWLVGSTVTGDMWASGTPLWNKSSSTRQIDWDEVWSVANWLLDHGANAAWIHPVFLTTPLHILARRAIRTTISELDLEILRTINNLLESREPDCCECFCSETGCNVLGCAVQESIRTPSYGIINKSNRLVVQSHLLALVQHHRDAAWISSAVLRVVTFKKLSLTHTCCYQIGRELDGYLKRPTPEEAKEIHDLERDDINILTTLVADFEAKWAAYKKPFVTFLNRVWKPQMQAIRNERRIDKADLSKFGVVLRDVSNIDDDSDDSRHDSESDWSDWPDDGPEGDADGWYTTDEEDANRGDEIEEEEVSDEGRRGTQESEVTGHETE
jgi:hypothetical protein